MHYLSSQDILDIHGELVDFFRRDGDPISPPGHRELGLIESAAERPRTGIAGHEKYKTVDEKAAALFHSLVKNHAFHNGNKRTALVSTVWFLDKNDRRIEADDEELFDFVRSVADGYVPGFDEPQNTDDFVEKIRFWIDARTSARTRELKGMKTAEFLDCVKSAGGSYRDASKGGTWIIFGPKTKNIRISKSTKQLDGPAIRRYVRILGLNEALSGVTLDEFQDGVTHREDIIRRLLVVLRKLAHI